MRIISKSSPAPRLLNTVAPDVSANRSAERPTANFSLKGASLFSGNGRAIFVGILVGSAILTILGVTYTRHQSLKAQRETAALAAALTTPSDPSAQLANPSAPIWAGQIHVTAISLGEPRLARVNGKHVTEGENVVIASLNDSTAVTLRVVKISDGQIDLSDGTQVVTARLETPRGLNRKP